MFEEQNPDLKTSIITLGETGCGKSSFCNTLFASKRFKVGHSLDSETEIVEGKYGENEYSDIFIIDTPGLNDSEGGQKDKENAEKMKEYIKKNPRIKGILMVFKYLGFFISNIDAIFNQTIPIPKIALPRRFLGNIPLTTFLINFEGSFFNNSPGVYSL